MMRLAWLPKLRALLSFIPLLQGCSFTLTLDLLAGPLLNPPAEGSPSSQILDIRVYQLKTSVDTTHLDWNKFLTPGGDMEQIGGALTDPQHPDCVVKQSIQADERRTLPKFKRLKGTTHLLIATLGHHKGSSSLRLHELGCFQQRETLCFSNYDVYYGDECARYLSGTRQ